MESFIPQSNNVEKKEKTVDPRLEILWDEYDFPGRPPFEGTTAEQRLKDSCALYSAFLNSAHYSDDRKKASDSERRRLHNEIALMVIGKQRSNIDKTLAEHIADFAFEYIKGYKMEDEDNR